MGRDYNIAVLHFVLNSYELACGRWPLAILFTPNIQGAVALRYMSELTNQFNYDAKVENIT